MLVLADAFEEVRTICMKPPKHEVVPITRIDYKPQLLVTEERTYQLDPAHYVKAREISRDAMFKQTRVNMVLIIDP